MVVVRDEPAGSSEDGVTAGFGASAVTAGGADVVGADAPGLGAVEAVAGDAAVEAVVAVVAGCWEKAADETIQARRRAGIAERRFMDVKLSGGPRRVKRPSRPVI
jgi:hypothetical protein